MEVKQLYELVNDVTKEVLGETAVLKEDLSNVVDIGTEIFNANAVDKYVKALVNRIGKVVFVNRPYKSMVPDVMMDNWEYGSVLEKVSGEIPEASENESWELEDGQSYDPNIFYKPKVSVKFFNSKTTFEVDVSYTDLQIKQSFTNATELNSFVSMLFTNVENSITIKFDNLILRTINNMVAETIYDEYNGAGLNTKSGVKAVNLLKLYNDMTGAETPLTTAKALYDLDFIKFASYTMKMYGDRIRTASRLYNIEGKMRFTPSDRLHFVLLSNFARSADVYLQSDTFHNEFVTLPKSEIVTYWQGTGTDYGFDSVSKIDVKTSNNHDVQVTGLIGIMFDRYALGVTNQDRRVKTNYNSKAEFWNNFYKVDASYFNDFSENMVCFFIA